MKSIFYIFCIFAAIDSTLAFNVAVNDTGNLYFLSTSVAINFGVTNSSTGAIDNIKLTVENATASLFKSEINGTTVNYWFNIHVAQNTPSFVKDLKFSIQAKSSNDDVRRFIQEFEVLATFDNVGLLANWSDTQLSFVVRPPSFPHFQVKTDWQYRCPVTLSLPFCNVGNGTSCIAEPPYKYVSVELLFTNTVFNGGKPIDHNYSDKIEECPLAYQTKQDIGIACIVAFWSIALAAVLWIVINFLMKRHRKRYD